MSNILIAVLFVLLGCACCYISIPLVIIWLAGKYMDYCDNRNVRRFL